MLGAGSDDVDLVGSELGVEGFGIEIRVSETHSVIVDVLQPCKEEPVEVGAWQVVHVSTNML